jgi:hypothetical protein
VSELVVRVACQQLACDLERAREKAWNERNDVVGDRRPDLYRLGAPVPIY